MSEPWRARVEFDFSLDDWVDVVWRATRRNPAARARRWRGIATAGGLAGLALPVLLCAAERTPPGWPRLLVGGGIAALAGAVLWATFVRRHFWRMAHEQLRQRFGAGPHRCVVELHDEHVSVHQCGERIELPWAEFHSLRDVGRDLYLRTTGGSVMVRGRAFADAGQRRRFRDLALALAAAARPKALAMRGG